MQPNASTPLPAQPIRDISPPADNLLGNPTQFANIPMQAVPGTEQAAHNNPIAGGNLPEAAPPPAAAQKKTDDLDKVLKDVNKEVKKSLQKPKPLSKPVLVITAAVIIGAALMAAAFFAFRAPS